MINLIEHEKLLRDSGVDGDQINQLMSDLWLVADERSELDYN